MYNDDNWNAVTGEELTGFLDQVNPIDGKFKATAENTKVMWRQLPFYDNVVLIRVTDSTWMPKNLQIFFLITRGCLLKN